MELTFEMVRYTGIGICILAGVGCVFAIVATCFAKDQGESFCEIDEEL